MSLDVEEGELSASRSQGRAARPSCIEWPGRACFFLHTPALLCWTLLDTSRTTAAKRDHSVPIHRLLLGLSPRKDSGRPTPQKI